jgi:hypothetical protein
MADVLTTEGLVLAITNESGGVFPFACAKNATLSISRDTIELAPKTNNVYREYIQGRADATISGSGLVKLAENNMQPITFFDGFIEGASATYVGYIDMIDNSNNYKLYRFSCIINELTLSSGYGNIPSYNFTLQVTGGFTELTVVDTYTVSGGTIPARSTATHKLVAVGYKTSAYAQTKWYFNYTVSAGPVINLGASLNGVSVVAAYIAL